MFLQSFSFARIEREEVFLHGIQRKVYKSFYPFRVLSAHHLQKLEFEPITILYGGNGSGKSTALNVIAEKLRLERESLYNRSNFFDDYLRYCEAEMLELVPKHSRIITSDDVFDFMLTLRSVNQGIDAKREQVFDDYLDAKYSHFAMKSLDDYEQLKRMNLARRTTQSEYTRRHLMANVPEHSNGESASLYFREKIQENALYLLDEPENSLSAGRQIELCQFLEECTRFFGCQFIIATHSPFLLALKGARIYDLDADPVRIRRWTELENVRTYYDFFMSHQKEFQ